MADKITRRDFIKKSAMGVVVGGVLLSSIDLGVLAAHSKRGKSYKVGEDIVIKLSDPKNADLAKVGGGIFLDDDDMLVRISQTQFLGLSLICKHKGCTVELQGDKFVCPCHGSEYALDGKVTHGPSKANLTTYETIYDPDKGTVTVKMDVQDKDNKEQKTDSTKIK